MCKENLVTGKPLALVGQFAIFLHTNAPSQQKILETKLNSMVQIFFSWFEGDADFLLNIDIDSCF